MSKTLTTLSLLAALALAGCGARLHPAARGVRYVVGTEAPSYCDYVGEVASGEGIGEATSLADLKVHLRNETALQDGDFLVIDSWERHARIHRNGHVGHYYVGTGRAYRCSYASEARRAARTL